MSKDSTENKLSDEDFTIWGGREGGANRNMNESTDGRATSANCRQLIESETVLVIRTSGKRLIIVRYSGHCCAYGRGIV